MRINLLLLTSLALVGSGCVTRSDIQSLQTDLYNIQKGLETRLGSVKDQTETVQTTQADLSQQMQTLSSNMTALQTELQDYLASIKSLSVRLDDLESSLATRIDSQIELLSGSKFVEKPSPSTIYNLANADFSRGKEDEALKGFESYIKQFPKGEQAPDAKLKMAEIYMKKKDSTKALDVLDGVISDYAKSSAARTAMLKKGQILEGMGKNSAAIKVYDSLAQTSPYSPEAKTARDRLATLRNQTNQ